MAQVPPSGRAPVSGTQARPPELTGDQLVGQDRLVTPPAGDASVQRTAESIILAEASVALGVRLEPRRLYLADGVRIEVDGVCDEPSVLCEVWAHQGPAKT